MTQFDDREKAFEKKFGLDEELEFKITIRTAILFGMWAARQMGLKASELESYAAKISEIAVARPGHDSLMEKIEKDFQAKGIMFTRHRLKKEINDCGIVARREATGQKRA